MACKAIVVIALATLASIAHGVYNDADCGETPMSHFVIGGKEASKGAWPWIASIRVDNGPQLGKDRWQHNCGGTLINRYWVLTAAHCVHDMDDDRLKFIKVVFGAHKLNGEFDETVEQERGVSMVIAHPSFDAPSDDGDDRTTMTNDVALLRLDSPVVFTDTVRSVCLPQPAKPGIKFDAGNHAGDDRCWLAGWGYWSKNPDDIYRKPENLLNVRGKIWKTVDCKRVWNGDVPGQMATWPDRIREGMLCFGMEKDRRYGGCMGDSGGPLVCPKHSPFQPLKYELVGAVSWGKGSCEDLPSVFTDVKFFVPWIEQQLGTYPWIPEQL